MLYNKSPGDRVYTWVLLRPINPPLHWEVRCQNCHLTTEATLPDLENHAVTCRCGTQSRPKSAWGKDGCRPRVTLTINETTRTIPEWVNTPLCKRLGITETVVRKRLARRTPDQTDREILFGRANKHIPADYGKFLGEPIPDKHVHLLDHIKNIVVDQSDMDELHKFVDIWGRNLIAKHLTAALFRLLSPTENTEDDIETPDPKPLRAPKRLQTPRIATPVALDTLLPALDDLEQRLSKPYPEPEAFSLPPTHPLWTPEKPPQKPDTPKSRVHYHPTRSSGKWDYHGLLLDENNPVLDTPEGWLEFYQRHSSHSPHSRFAKAPWWDSSYERPFVCQRHMAIYLDVSTKRYSKCLPTTASIISNTTDVKYTDINILISKISLTNWFPNQLTNLSLLESILPEFEYHTSFWEPAFKYTWADQLWIDIPDPVRALGYGTLISSWLDWEEDI